MKLKIYKRVLYIKAELSFLTDMSPHTPRGQRSFGGAPHPQQHLTPGRSPMKSHSPQPQPRTKTPLSTGLV